MTKHRLIIYLSCLMFLFGSVFLSRSQTNLTVNEIIEKNIQAAGGEDNLAKVKNYSFTYGPMTYYMTTSGLVKLTKGREHVITEITLIDQDKVKRNSFNKVTELTGFQKSSYQCLAKLRCGLFTLINFKDQLAFKGLKNFGAEKLYMLTTNVDELKVEFYLDSDEWTLKRLVLKGFNPSRGKYEVNHDFGPYKEIDGLKIPSSWFRSQVGTRGRTYEISNIKMNQTLNKDFFSKLDVNVGEVAVSDGSLEGNIIDFRVTPGNLYITTNWTNEYIQEAGLKTKDKLIFQINDMDVELDFYASISELPPRSSFSQGAKLMFQDNRLGETYLIYFYSTEFAQVEQKLELLLPIRVKRK